MKNIPSFLLASLVLSTAAKAAIAAPFSDAFDSGLSQWLLTGDVAVQSASGNPAAFLTTAYNAEQDDFPLASGALNISGNATAAAGGDLENFAGISVGGLDLDSLNQATEGSAMKATFTVPAGASISFDWQLSTRDADAGVDYAFVTINGLLMNLATAASATLAGTGDYFNTTDLAHFEFTAPAAGDYTITIGITDIGDYSGTSALRVDNFAVTVPEAGSSLLALAGLSLAALRRRRSA